MGGEHPSPGGKNPNFKPQISIISWSTSHHVMPEMLFSEAWGPPQFQEKRSRSEKAILGALGDFRGILGAALGIQNSILGIRNSILGMAFHDLSNTKTTTLGATPGVSFS